MASVGYITQQVVDAMKAAATDQWVWERMVRGSLGVKITPKGRVFASFQWGNPPKQKRRTLGELSKSFTIADARAQATKLGSELYATGDEEAPTVQALTGRFTVGDLALAYMGSEVFKTKAEKTQHVDRGRINGHIIPLLGRVRCDRLTHDDCLQMMADIRNGKTAKDEITGYRKRRIIKGGDGVAKKCRLLLSAMWKWGKKNKKVFVDDPGISIVAGTYKRRRICWGPTEYANIVAAVDMLQSELEIKGSQANAVRFILWTGARLGEVMAAKWEHYDREDARIVLTEHKTDKTGEDRIISLPPQAVKMLDAMAVVPGGFIFAGRGGFPVNLKKVVPKIRKQPGVPADFILHGLRHSLASAMARSGAAASDIMFQLGHAKITTSQGYIAAAGDQRSQIAARAAAAIFQPLDRASAAQ